MGPEGEDALEAATGDQALVGRVALEAQVALSELSGRRTDLERLFLELPDSPEHRNRNLGGHDAPATNVPTEGDAR